MMLALVWWQRGVGGRSLLPQVAALGAAGATALVLRAAAIPGLLPTTAQGASVTRSLLLPLQTLVFAFMSLFAPVARIVVDPDPARLGTLRALAGLLVAGSTWAGAGILCAPARRALRHAALAGAIALLPVLNILPQETRLSERFLYLGSAFLLVPVVLLVQRAWETRGRRRAMVAAATAVGVGAMLWISTWRARVWRDDVRVWQQAVREEPERAAFWDRLGLAHTERRAFGAAEEAAEGFALEEIIRLADATDEEAYSWAVHSQGELDLLIVKDGRRLGFEFKYADSPRTTSAGRMAMKQLKLDQLTMICPGDAAHELEDGVRVRGLSRVVSAGRF